MLSSAERIAGSFTLLPSKLENPWDLQCPDRRRAAGGPPLQPQAGWPSLPGTRDLWPPPDTQPPPPHPNLLPTHPTPSHSTRQVPFFEVTLNFALQYDPDLLNGAVVATALRFAEPSGLLQEMTAAGLSEVDTRVLQASGGSCEQARRVCWVAGGAGMCAGGYLPGQARLPGMQALWAQRRAGALRSVGNSGRQLLLL